ncbi:MAG: hypothetical protein QM817_36680 [Archangium sp.]
MTALLVAMLLSADPNPDACTKDADCVITTLTCCPTCCGPVPYAATPAAIDAKKKKCAVIECEGKPANCPQCEAPPPPDAWAAKCEKKVCVAKLKK